MNEQLHNIRMKRHVVWIETVIQALADMLGRKEITLEADTAVLTDELKAGIRNGQTLRVKIAGREMELEMSEREPNIIIIRGGCADGGIYWLFNQAHKLPDVEIRISEDEELILVPPRYHIRSIEVRVNHETKGGENEMMNLQHGMEYPDESGYPIGNLQETLFVAAEIIAKLGGPMLAEAKQAYRQHIEERRSEKTKAARLAQAAKPYRSSGRQYVKYGVC